MTPYISVNFSKLKNTPLSTILHQTPCVFGKKMYFLASFLILHSHCLLFYLFCCYCKIHFLKANIQKLMHINIAIKIFDSSSFKQYLYNKTNQFPKKILLLKFTLIERNFNKNLFLQLNKKEFYFDVQIELIALHCGAGFYKYKFLCLLIYCCN